MGDFEDRADFESYYCLTCDWEVWDKRIGEVDAIAMTHAGTTGHPIKLREDDDP